MKYKLANGEIHTEDQVRANVQKLIDANGGWWVVGPLPEPKPIGFTGIAYGNIRCIIIGTATMEEARQDCAVLGLPFIGRTDGFCYKVATD